MRIPEEIEKAFYTGVRHPQASLCINDTVEVISGPCKGRGGAVISIVQLEPSPVFLVELGDTGEDVQVSLDSLKLLD